MASMIPIVAKFAVIGVFRFLLANTPAMLPHLKALVDATRLHDGCIANDIAFVKGTFNVE